MHNHAPYSRKEVGNKGEELACRFLRRKGFSIIERNFWQKCGEIDIVARDARGVFRFVEVKTVVSEVTLQNREDVSPEGSYRPEDNVHPSKLRRLERTIARYLEIRHIESDWQCDVVAIRLDLKRKLARASFIENVF